MNKQIFILLFALAGVSVSCEKSDWFSPDEVDSIKATYEDQINNLSTANNTLTSQAADLTTQVSNLTTSVSTLEAEVSTLTTSNSTLSSNTTVNLNTIAGLNSDVSSLTTQVASLTAQIATLDAEIVTLNTAITNSASLTSQVASLTSSVASLTTQVATLEAQANALEAEILIFKDFKTLRDKLNFMVAATITDANLNTAVDNVSVGLTTSSLTSTTLKGLITDESNWIFNNAIKSGTVSMTASATTFYDNSTDTNVVNFRNLVTEMTTAWNALKETQFILWWIEFIKEYENL